MGSKLNVLNQIGVHFTQEYHQEQLRGLKVISSPHRWPTVMVVGCVDLTDTFPGRCQSSNLSLWRMHLAVELVYCAYTEGTEPTVVLVFVGFVPNQISLQHYSYVSLSNTPITHQKTVQSLLKTKYYLNKCKSIKIRDPGSSTRKMEMKHSGYFLESPSRFRAPMSFIYTEELPVASVSFLRSFGGDCAT